MSETTQKSSWFTSCLGKFVFWLWLMIIGAVGGVWLGINIERMYPGLSVPNVPLVENIVGQIPIMDSKIRTSDGLIISILGSTRMGKNLDIHFSVSNDGNKPVELDYDSFLLTDNQQRVYQKTIINQDRDDARKILLSFLDPLNPGLTEDYHLVFTVPTNVKKFDLYYKDTKIGKVQ